MGSSSTVACILGFLLCIVSTLAIVPGSWPQKPTGYNLTMKPEHFLLVNSSNSSDVSVLCTLRDAAGNTVPLSGCGFSVYRTEIAWEFNYGPGSPSVELDGLRGRYHGRGLEHGECGLSFGGLNKYGPYILGCRVRPTSGKAWQSKAMMLHATSMLPMDFHIQPSGVTLAVPGSNITLIGKSKLKLSACTFKYHDLTHWPNLRTHFYAGNATLACDNDNGPDKKECYVTLLDLQPEMSGFFVMYCYHDPESGSPDYVELIVATAPNEMGMTNETMIIDSNQVVLDIACWAKKSRPVASITWVLDGEVIRQDAINDGPVESEWLWNHDPQSITQHQTIKAFPKYNGKTLVCRVDHVALPLGTINFSTVLIVEYAPIFELPSPDTGIIIRGVGGECTLAAKVNANPPAVNFTWTKDSEDQVILSEGHELNLKHLTVGDSGWYTCTAANSLGSAYITFQLTVLECHVARSNLITASITCAILIAVFGGLVALLKFYKCFHWAGRPRLDSQEMEPVLEAENTDSYWH